ncbi:ssDNA-binding domain-containing protein [Geomonas sp. RF6]|uniref:ArdC family protein n=1 Tax=Geomonas sp. RF6 TaxID=2897342 RepID=UPI001E645699|nr:zincin-like metallopeptidase domain-containing protein [Geomonas sp. RF6]UFS71760.1 ssDNA-binding domain-containing protein [Geomonas sp. RF6]
MCKTYDVINARITELLEAGTVPWRKTWNAEANVPKNLVSGKEYRGINIFLLGCMTYGSPYWLTFKQATEKGGHVRKGEKSSPVIFWKWIDRKDADGDDAEDTSNGKVPLLRYYSVFNLEQVEGIPSPPSPENIINPFTPIERAEQIIAGMPLRPDIRHGGNEASYSPMLDYVRLPEPSAFQSPEEYYSTVFHELTHATGHASRVGRKGILEPSFFGSHSYSKEELVAEMGAAFLCGIAGIEQGTIVNSAAYIRGWLKALKDDKKMLVMAAAQAQKSSDYILHRKGGEVDQAEDSAE